MRVSYKILGWLAVGMGVNAIVWSFFPFDGYMLFAGVLFAATGFSILDLLKKLKH
jgi:uncharacterized membrane protein YbaN (DUF454 family)